jgi:VanZ family protein
MRRSLLNFKKVYSSIWPAMIWSAFVLILLLIPIKRKTESSFFSLPHVDKVIHLFLFLILSFLWHQYLVVKHENIRKLNIIGLFLAVVLYGIMLEYIQIWTGRDFDPLDMMANAAGALTGIIIKKSRTDIVRDK